MSASIPFRSHLLQQWARNSQSRSPPAVVVPWIKNQQHQRQHLLSNTSFVQHNNDDHQDEQEESSPTSTYLSSSNATTSTSSSLARSFQSLMMTRHTGTSFARKAVVTQEKTNQQQQQSLLASAIDRAVACGQMAPNHKRTEPFSFKRLIAPSDTTRRLSDIAYHVNLLHNPNSSIKVAEKKRQKWLDVAAFLVALCHDNQDPSISISALSKSSQNDEEGDDDIQGLDYQRLPYSAPQTERQLEDYAAACAAVQNVLLSLHAEQIASKWATGPVIETPAFRELISADPTDRIVALIMIGPFPTTTARHPTMGGDEDLWLPSSAPQSREERRLQHRRQRSRSIQGDLLVDL